MSDRTNTEKKPIISRDDLRYLRDLALSFAQSKSANHNWKKHLVELSHKCDTLDAVMARAGINAMELDNRKIKRIMDTAENKKEAEKN